MNPTEQTVVCPRCSATLAVPDHGTKLSKETILPVVEEHAADEHPSSIFNADDRPNDGITVPSSIKVPDFSQWGKHSPDSALLPEADDVSDEAMPPSEIPSSPVLRPNVPAFSDSPAGGATAPNRDATATETTADSKGRVSRAAFLALTIYASAVTAICLGLLYLAFTNRAHQLESLPDVVPPRDAEGAIAREIVPSTASLPPGHVLELGESQRFGDLLVTPLKVTREPLRFTHYQGNQTREPAGNVLKLWLRLENVSRESKSFAPIDADLLFYRVAPSNRTAIKTNNFLASASNRSPEQLVAMYDHPVGSDWDLADQKLGTEISPGETLVTYLPTETEFPQLSGTLVWRVHLRKGIADNGWGVTTLVDVTFPAAAISGGS